MVIKSELQISMYLLTYYVPSAVLGTITHEFCNKLHDIVSSVDPRMPKKNIIIKKVLLKKEKYSILEFLFFMLLDMEDLP